MPIAPAATSRSTIIRSSPVSYRAGGNWSGNDTALLHSAAPVCTVIGQDVLGVPAMRASPWAWGSMAIVRIGDIAAWEMTSLSQTGRSCPPAPSVRCNVCQARQAADSSIGCQTGVRPILRSAPRWQPVGCESAGRIDRGRGRDHALWRRDELALNAKMAEGVSFVRLTTGV
jgi:hypothetical protein